MGKKHGPKSITELRFLCYLLFQWDLVCDRASLTKTTSTIFFLGVMTGAIAVGHFSDKYVYEKHVSNIFMVK